MATKGTHVAVHEIRSRDAKGNRVIVKPGTPFTPEKDDVDGLMARGAIRKAKSEDFTNLGKDSNLDAEAAAANVSGYAPNTDTSLEGGLTGNENDALDPEQRIAEGDSATAAAKAPVSRSTSGARR